MPFEFVRKLTRREQREQAAAQDLEDEPRARRPRSRRPTRAAVEVDEEEAEDLECTSCGKAQDAIIRVPVDLGDDDEDDDEAFIGLCGTCIADMALSFARARVRGSVAALREMTFEDALRTLASE
jgi:hypothetical protein